MKVNTELCIDLKTKLQNEVLMKPGKKYPGILRRDVVSEDYGFDDSHYTFIETLPPTAGKRNPHVFDGKLITVTRRDDGSYRPNFKPMKVDADFSIVAYAYGVAKELIKALKDLVEEKAAE